MEAIAVEEQCPLCEYNTYTNLCGKKRQRINKNERGEFFKTVPCPLWAKKVNRSTLVGLEICPTCGRPLEEPCVTTFIEIAKADPLPVMSEGVSVAREPRAERVDDSGVIPIEPSPEKSIKKPRKRSVKIFTEGRPKHGGSKTT